MGKVWIGGAEIGVFKPQIEGTSGSIFVSEIDIGVFTLAATGYVYLNGLQIGTYYSLLPPPPPPPPPSLVEDARFRTKRFLETYIANSYLTKDDGVTPVAFAVMYADPDYLIKLEFFASSNPVDLLFVVTTPVSEPLIDIDNKAYGYEEKVPVSIYCIDKTGITGTKLRWKAEAELRRITETYPMGSLRTWDRMEPNDENLGSTILHSVTYILNYMRDTT